MHKTSHTQRFAARSVIVGLATILAACSAKAASPDRDADTNSDVDAADVTPDTSDETQTDATAHDGSVEDTDVVDAASDSGDQTQLDADAESDTTLDDTSDTDVADAVDLGPCPDFVAPQRRGHLPDAVNEVSGLVASNTHEGVLWAHNDSGDGPNLYAVEGETGTLRATITLQATARDWEDMSAGPCAPSDSTTCLYLGDIGDNDARYSSITIYRLAEPSLADAVDVATEAMELVYPDGPRNAESMIVDETGTVWILSKERGFAGVYSAPFVTTNESPFTLTYHGQIDLSSLIGRNAELATGADYSQTLRRVLVRTYTSIIDIPLGDGQTLADLPGIAFTERPVGLEIQGEAIAWSDDSYWHVAEGDNTVIYEVVCSDRAGD